MREGFTTIENRFHAILANLPNRPVAWLVRFIIQLSGPRSYGPSDNLIKKCAEILLTPSAQRDRLTAGLHPGDENSSVYILEKAFNLFVETRPFAEKMNKAQVNDIEQASQLGILSKGEAGKLKAADKAIAEVIAVDDFEAGSLMGIQKE